MNIENVPAVPSSGTSFAPFRQSASTSLSIFAGASERPLEHSISCLISSSLKRAMLTEITNSVTAGSSYFCSPAVNPCAECRLPPFPDFHTWLPTCKPPLHLERVPAIRPNSRNRRTSPEHSCPMSGFSDMGSNPHPLHLKRVLTIRFSRRNRRSPPRLLTVPLRVDIDPADLTHGVIPVTRPPPVLRLTDQSRLHGFR